MGRELQLDQERHKVSKNGLKWCWFFACVCLLFLVIYTRYLHVDNGGNCTPLSLHSWMMRAFTFRQMSNTLKQDKKEYFKELQKEMSNVTVQVITFVHLKQEQVWNWFSQKCKIICFNKRQTAERRRKCERVCDMMTAVAEKWLAVLSMCSRVCSVEDGERDG